MELVNQAYRYRTVGGGNPQVMRDVIEGLLKMLAPMAPYITEEAWHRLGHEDSIHSQSWPVYEVELASDDEVTMVVQVNGKVRDTIQVPADVEEDKMRELALGSAKVQAFLDGKEPRKVIVRPPKLVNLVV
jgi:leucyl-tRNA synthetase